VTPFIGPGLRCGAPLHLEHLGERARQSGHWPEDQTFGPESLQELLSDRIARLDVDNARHDIERFLSDPMQLEMWSQVYFQDLAQRIQLV